MTTFSSKQAPGKITCREYKTRETAGERGESEIPELGERERLGSRLTPLPPPPPSPRLPGNTALLLFHRAVRVLGKQAAV